MSFILNKFFGRLKAMFSDDLGIDLGTMNTLVCLTDKGIVIDEPSVVACNTENGRVIAVGSEAKRMLGRAPGNIKTYRPVKSGVIAEAAVTETSTRSTPAVAVAVMGSAAGSVTLVRNGDTPGTAFT